MPKSPIADLRVEQWPIGRLVGYPGNPRKNDQAVDRMCEAITEYGFRIPIVAKSDGLIVDGHLRHKAALKLGIKTVPVALADDLTEVQIRAFRLLANQSASWAEWDMPLLKLELEELRLQNYPLALTGFDDVQLVQFMANISTNDPEATPEPPATPITRKGDLWVMGRHRMLCGDARSEKDFEMLLDGVTPDLANCDPPYGISIVKSASVGGAKPFGKIGGGKPHPFASNLGRVPAPGRDGFGRVHGKAAKAIIQPGVYAPVIGDDSTDTAVAAHEMLCGHGIESIVLWGGNYFADCLPASRCWLVWDKENTGSFADVELAWTNQDAIARIFHHQWSGLIKASERGERRVHPTQKPVALAEWVIETIAPSARSMVDLFVGSGSSLIAAERKGIQHFGMEMAEAYVDATLMRWQDFATGEAILESTGQTFAEVKAEREAKPKRRRRAVANA